MYKVPANAATATIIEKKSEFIASIARTTTEEEALGFLSSVRAAHSSASHNVYAYVLRKDARTRYCDDGEPAKTAGLPVLAVIQHAQLFNCIIVVTRYFGGTLLGTGGLVRAYTAAASAAVQKAGFATIRTLATFTLSLPYSLYQQTMRILTSAGAVLKGEPIFTDVVSITACLPAEDADMLKLSLLELFRSEDGITISLPYEDFW